LLCARLSRVDCVTRRVYDELTGDKLTGSLFRPTATDRCQSQETFRLISVIPWISDQTNYSQIKNQPHKRRQNLLPLFQLIHTVI